MIFNPVSVRPADVLAREVRRVEGPSVPPVYVLADENGRALVTDTGHALLCQS